jgi:hypothetical protein
MGAIFHERDADPAAIAGQSIAVVGYGNQGRSWALNLRDSGHAPQVCVKNDASRDRAIADGFAAQELAAASHAGGSPLPSVVLFPLSSTSAWAVASLLTPLQPACSRQRCLRLTDPA